MAEYVAGRGTTALGVVGTVLGGIGTAAAMANGGNLLGNWGNGCNNGCWNNGGYNGYAYPVNVPYQASTACMHDVETAERIASKDAEIARLQSERYADSVRDDAKQYGIEIYKELKKDITEIKDTNNNRWTDQMVVNANLTNGMTAMNGQIQATANLVAQITRTAVPQSAICSFGENRSCGCGTNI